MKKTKLKIIVKMRKINNCMYCTIMMLIIMMMSVKT